MYDGKVIVERSIDLEEPVIYVSMNYRVTGQLFYCMPFPVITSSACSLWFLGRQRSQGRWNRELGPPRSYVHSSTMHHWQWPISIIEREALRWVQKYIGAFGGDPEKVTM
jgi:hypothetical protein